MFWKCCLCQREKRQCWGKTRERTWKDEWLIWNRNKILCKPARCQPELAVPYCLAVGLCTPYTPACVPKSFLLLHSISRRIHSFMHSAVDIFWSHQQKPRVRFRCFGLWLVLFAQMCPVYLFYPAGFHLAQSCRSYKVTSGYLRHLWVIVRQCTTWTRLISLHLTLRHLKGNKETLSSTWPFSVTCLTRILQY